MLNEVLQPSGVSVWLDAPLVVDPEGLTGFFVKDRGESGEGHSCRTCKAEVQVRMVAIASPAEGYYNRNKSFSSCPFAKAPETDTADEVSCGINEDVFRDR